MPGAAATYLCIGCSTFLKLVVAEPYRWIHFLQIMSVYRLPLIVSILHELQQDISAQQDKQLYFLMQQLLCGLWSYSARRSFISAPDQSFPASIAKVALIIEEYESASSAVLASHLKPRRRTLELDGGNIQCNSTALTPYERNSCQLLCPFLSFSELQQHVVSPFTIELLRTMFLAHGSRPSTFCIGKWDLQVSSEAIEQAMNVEQNT